MYTTVATTVCVASTFYVFKKRNKQILSTLFDLILPAALPFAWRNTLHKLIASIKQFSKCEMYTTNCACKWDLSVLFENFFSSATFFEFECFVCVWFRQLFLFAFKIAGVRNRKCNESTWAKCQFHLTSIVRIKLHHEWFTFNIHAQFIEMISGPLFCELCQPSHEPDHIYCCLIVIILQHFIA